MGTFIIGHMVLQELLLSGTLKLVMEEAGERAAERRTDQEKNEHPLKSRVQGCCLTKAAV